MRQAAGEVTGPEIGQLDDVLERFGLGKTVAARRVAEGLMNRNWEVTTSGDELIFVKQVLDVDEAQARLQHAATRALASRDLPVAAPLPAPDGRTLVEAGGGFFAVYPWISGIHLTGPGMSVTQASALGAVLGRLHVELAQIMPGAGTRMVMPVTGPAKALDAIGRYEALITQRPERTGFDEFAAGQLPRRRLLIESSLGLQPDPASQWEPSGWTHGDFHDLNVLWDERGQVTAVLDFDRLAPRPYAFELVRSATLTFSRGDDRGLDLDQVTAFVNGYAGVFPLSPGQILQAVRGLWWERACDFWQLKSHYVKDDNSCDHLFRSASSLLWWWTGHQGDVEDAFTSR